MAESHDNYKLPLARQKELQPQIDVFTSDLSVDEFLLLEPVGFQPLGMVVGTSIYHIGSQQTRPKVSEEMVVLSEALYGARKHALKRMIKQAEALTADGIVGVRLKIGHLEFNPELIYFVALGTAVADPHYDWSVAGAPFSSSLSGQDFATLVRSGYRPLGMVMGNCVYHVAQQSGWQALKVAMKNVEMTNFTEAFYEARELSMERMQLDAEKLGATGVVGVDILEGQYAWEGEMLEFLAIGTAIAPMQDKHYLVKPHLVLSLNDEPDTNETVHVTVGEKKKK